MFCPKCATQNLDGASFCRSCGANISLVPQAMTGQIARQSEETSVAKEEHGQRSGKELTLDAAFKNVFMGFAFLIIAIVLSRLPFGWTWWFWMLLPAFSLMGVGIAQLLRLRQRDNQHLDASSNPRSFANRPTAQPLSAPHTDQLIPPVPSVTEGTTRHLSRNNPDNQ
ncbi:MAG TPA: zinc-ribbon domain-containing protein [Pyrinomonadaceae bacterium]|nr:zinc-ribbon domain-containing protein [Pyrinomonadaceae bacterium]